MTYKLIVPSHTIIDVRPISNELIINDFTFTLDVTELNEFGSCSNNWQ